ncbi:hypothetical protein BC940DRAFT_317286 [Gongronella butleri]|nr:hypothetical protein BC940DRAFT_317286 [Gongronella butleri]
MAILLLLSLAFAPLFLLLLRRWNPDPSVRQSSRPIGLVAHIPMRPAKRVHERPARHIRGAASRHHAQQQPRRERLVKRAVDVARRRSTMRSVLAPETLARWVPTPQEDGPAEDCHSSVYAYYDSAKRAQNAKNKI